jgi:hypothetical protein
MHERTNIQLSRSERRNLEAVVAIGQCMKRHRHQEFIRFLNVYYAFLN